MIYAVQSALWYFQKGNKSGTGKYTIEWASEDNIKLTTKTINGGYNGLESRNNFIKKAREDNGFKVFQHYLYMHKKGTDTQKKNIIKQLKYLKNDEVVVLDKKNNIIINLKDERASDLLKRINDKPIAKLKPKGILLKIDRENIKFKLITEQ